MSQESNYNRRRSSEDGREPRERSAAHRGPREEARRQPPRRRRRRMGATGVLLYVVFVLGVSALLAGLGWTWANDVLALNKEPLTAAITLPDEIFTEKEITVDKEDENGKTVKEQKTVKEADMGYVAKVLKDNGLIEYKGIFKIFASVTHAKYKLAPGTYELNTDMDYRALLGSLGNRSASRMVTTVTIPEGMTEAQIFAMLEEKGVAKVEDLMETAANYDFKYSFLKGVVPLGDARRLEGYLFPDTYEFYMGDDPVRVINKMILRFDEIFSDDLRQVAAQNGRTIQEIVTIASMIEKETDGNDQNRISSVIYNRLTHPAAGGTYGYLNIDATILYATGGTEVDTKAETPYNTYLHTGLPPTAIANPGVRSLRAALYPEKTGYYYYALGDDGVHHFFKSYDAMLNWMATQERY